MAAGKSSEQNKKEPSQPPIPHLDPHLLAAMYSMQQKEDEIDLLGFWRAIRKSRVLILAIALGFGILAYGYSKTLPNLYKAEVVLAPASGTQVKGGSLGGGLGGLASLAGISVGGGGSEEDLAVLKSRNFLWHFIKEENLMPVLFKEAWDADKGAWKNASPARRPARLVATSAIAGVFSVSSGKNSSLLRLAVVREDPEQAAEWANALVASFNEYQRQQAIAESRVRLDYLERELARTEKEDMRLSLFQLISQEQNKAMLANTRPQYAFRVIDEAVPAAARFSPNRRLIAIGATLVGAFAALLFVLIREGLARRKAEATEDDGLSTATAENKA